MCTYLKRRFSSILLSKEHRIRAEVEQAARYVYADKFIEQLPQGYDFHLEKNGSNLSVDKRSSFRLLERSHKAATDDA